jgi:hypothetical protein
LADYNANIRVSADTKRAESQLSKLEKTLNQLSDFTLKLNSRSLQAEANKIGQSLRGIGERGALGALTLAAGKATTAVTGLGAKFGLLGAAAASAGATINGALGGVPAVIGDILNQVGSIPNAFGLAAVAAMAFAPQLTKAAASAVGLGAAVDKAVGAGVTSKIAGLTASVGQLNVELNTTKTSFADLLGGSALNKLVAQLNDAQKQVGEYVAFSDESVTAVQQLLTVERLVTREKRAQAALVNQLNADTLRQNARIQQNLIASRNSRAGSGFNAFSTAATAVEGSRAIDKAIRRNFEKRAAGAPPAPAAPLMLPSSEMLLSGGRRIERLTADPGIQAARAYTQELTRAVGAGRQLDGIFTQVSKAMAATADGAAKGNRITQSWAKALREMAQIQSDITELSAKEAQLQRQTAEAQRRKNFGRQAESLALGVGFPLLFGGGVGSVAGAAAGSFVGTGFGGQILGGAIGQIADQFAQAAAKMGSALRAPVENFKEIADAGLLASRSQERYIQKLIDAGRTAEASALIQGEIVKKIGVQGMKDLQNAGAASDKLNKSMAELGLQMQAAVAGPLADLLSWVNGLVSAANNTNRAQAQQRDFLAQLSNDPARRTEYFRRSQALMQANGGVVDTVALQRLQREMLPGGVPKQLPSPGSTTESQQLRATTAEMQAQVNLASKQLGLAGLTLEKDGARYVQAAKAVALQEYDNRLLEIKNSWVGKIFDREQNLAQIRAANLEYSAKLRGIDAQVAQRADQNGSSVLQAEKALYDQRADSINLLVRIAEVTGGEEAGLRKQLELYTNLTQQRLAAFEVEKELALKEAARNGTLPETVRLYNERQKALNNQLYLEQLVTQEKLSQLKLEQSLNNQRQKRAFEGDMAGLIAPANRTPLQALAIDQAQRRDSLLGGRFIQLDEMQQRLAAAGPGTATSTVTKLKEDIARVNDEINQLSIGLATIEAKEVVWTKNRSGVEALLTSLNAVGTTVTNVFANLVAGTDSWTNSLNNALGALANVFVQAGLSALGGNDGRGFFSFITGNLGKKAANGAYFSNGIAAFGRGGMFANNIVSSPTLFKFANGGAMKTGVMGEAGPEAIMPLTRGPGGRLGVESYGGGGGVSVVVNVDASGSKVQGDDARGKELGRVVSVAVQQEIIKQKRPGGLLA